MDRQKKEKRVGPQEYQLIPVDPSDVAFNQDNPRGESAEAINADPEFTALVESVHQFGVLVPIVVYKQEGGANKKRYRLVDGERRLRAALKTKCSSVPAHVAKSTPSTNDLVQAFHIHMLRKQWGQTAQTRALKLIINDLKRNRADRHKDEFFSTLQSLTGYKRAELTAFLRASKYSDTVLDDVDKKRLQWSHLVQFEESFLEPVKEYYPSLFRRFGEKALRQMLLKKAKRKVLSGTRALMEHIVPVVSRAKREEEKSYAEDLLTQFINDGDMAAEEVLKRFNRRFPEPQSDLPEVLDMVIEKADSLEHLLRSLPKGEAIRRHAAKARELYDSLDRLAKVVAEKKRLCRSIIN